MSDNVQYMEFVSISFATPNDISVLQCPLSSRDPTTSHRMALRTPTEHLVGVVVSPNIRMRETPMEWTITLDVNGQERTFPLGSLVRRNDGKRFDITHTVPIFDVCVGAEPMGGVAVSDPGERPEEEKIVTEIVRLMLDESVNPRKGSMRCVDIAELVREHLPHESAVVFPSDADAPSFGIDEWKAFLDRHESIFTHFCYSSEEIGTRGLSGVVQIGEVLVGLKPEGKCGKALDFANMSQRDEDELNRMIIEQLGGGTMTVRNLYSSLPPCSEQMHLCPTFEVFMQIVQKHKDVLWWSTDPEEPTRFGLKETLPPHPEPSGKADVHQEDPDNTSVPL